MIVIYSLGVMFRFIIKLFFDNNIKKKFVMYFSTWNANVFKVSNPFHVYK